MPNNNNNDKRQSDQRALFDLNCSHCCCLLRCWPTHTDTGRHTHRQTLTHSHTQLFTYFFNQSLQPPPSAALKPCLNYARNRLQLRRLSSPRCRCRKIYRQQMHFTRYLCSLAQNILASTYIVCTDIGRSSMQSVVVVYSDCGQSHRF